MLQLAEPDVPGKATADGSLQFTRAGRAIADGPLMRRQEQKKMEHVYEVTTRM